MTLLLGVELVGLPVVLAGGGPVAARRAAGLLGQGADVHVVAPWLCEDLDTLAAAGRVRWSPRDVVAADLDGVWLAHTATGDPHVDAAVAGWARERRVLCVDAGGTGGAATARSVATTVAGDVLVGACTDAAAGGPDPRRSAAAARRVGELLAEGGVPLRRHRPGRGRVVLVGGGPGDPGLLTVRGRRALAEADVVVADRLGPVSVLSELADEVEVVDVGKNPGRHPVPQHEIEALLVERAARGQVVVRLKGGDPYVLGRGGEEVAACRAAGIDVEVVPGVSSALAAPAAAGIPVTHRGLSRGVLVVSGHEDLDWPLLARWRGTLVVLMGVARLAETAERLVAHGLDPATPAAVVEDATLGTQRTTRARIDGLAAAARAAGVRSPAVVVVGDVAALGAGATSLGEAARAVGAGAPATMGS